MKRRCRRASAVVVLGRARRRSARQCSDLPGARPRAPAERRSTLSAVRAARIATSPRSSPPARPIVGLCAGGILIRAVAPLLADKHDEPPVVAVAEDGSVARAAARRASRRQRAGARASPRRTGGHRGDHHRRRLRFGFALDEPPPGWRIARPGTRQADQRPRCSPAEPLVRPASKPAPRRLAAQRRVRGPVGDAAELVIMRHRPRGRKPTMRCAGLHPPVLALGIGCERGRARRGESPRWSTRPCRARASPPERSQPWCRSTLKVRRAGDPRSRCTGSACRRGFFRRRACSARRRGLRALRGGVPRDRLLGRGGRRGARCRRAGGALVVPSANRARATCAIARSAAADRRRRRSAARAAGSPSSASAPAIPPGAPPEATRARRCRRHGRLRPLSRSARPRDRRQDAARQRDRRRGGAGAARARSRRRGPVRWRWSRRAMPASTVWRRSSSSCSTARGAATGRASRSGRARACRRCRPRRRGRRAARPRFLRDLAVRSADAVGGDRAPARGRGRRRFRRRALQSALGAAARRSSPRRAKSCWRIARRRRRSRWRAISAAPASASRSPTLAALSAPTSRHADARAGRQQPRRGASPAIRRASTRRAAIRRREPP